MDEKYPPELTYKGFIRDSLTNLYNTFMSYKGVGITMLSHIVMCEVSSMCVDTNQVCKRYQWTVCSTFRACRVKYSQSEYCHQCYFIFTYFAD